MIRTDEHGNVRVHSEAGHAPVREGWDGDVVYVYVYVYGDVYGDGDGDGDE